MHSGVTCSDDKASIATGDMHDGLVGDLEDLILR
jgi:hypothetical protein